MVKWIWIVSKHFTIQQMDFVFDRNRKSSTLFCESINFICRTMKEYCECQIFSCVGFYSLPLEISGGPLGVKPAIQAHLGVENIEKHTFGQNCPKSDATVKTQNYGQVFWKINLSTKKYLNWKTFTVEVLPLKLGLYFRRCMRTLFHVHLTLTVWLIGIILLVLEMPR